MRLARLIILTRPAIIFCALVFLLSSCCPQARRGLDRGFKPELTLEGTGGTYFLQDAARQKVAVFKPQDEEPFAPNNPRWGSVNVWGCRMREGPDGEARERCPTPISLPGAFLEVALVFCCSLVPVS